MRESRKRETRSITGELVELRKEHADDVNRAQSMLKRQQAARKMLKKALQEGPCSVPQLAAQTGICAHEILWHIASMKKYGVVTEAGTDESGDYFLYGLALEAKQ
jgi:biotin operon repressor